MTISKFEELDEFLLKNDPDDQGWGEAYIEVAIGIIRNFVKSDIEIIENEWPTRNSDWKVLFVHIMDELPESSFVDIALKFIAQESDEISWEAAATLGHSIKFNRIKSSAENYPKSIRRHAMEKLNSFVEKKWYRTAEGEEIMACINWL